MKHFTIVCILIVSIVGNALTRDLAQKVRGQPLVAASDSGHSLSGMNSYALALLLGGLRGPLVMFLWSSSESQKNENDLEDFDSKVEWIRLLQPEFDSVHLFEIWNKAFNISVKMTNESNKYTTILDALKYAHDVDAEKPNDLNIISAMGDIDFNKLGYADTLGSATERRYFDERVRKDSLWRVNNVSSGSASAVRRTRMDPMLDKDFNLLPRYTTPQLTTPLTDAADAGAVYDGSEFQFLKPFQPFPYGISPLGLAYNYYQRAQLLQLLGKQHHWYQSDLVTDSRPAVALTYWAMEEAEAGRRAELAALGQAAAPEADRNSLETPAAGAALTAPIADRAAYDEAIYRYKLAASLNAEADGAFERHIERYKSFADTYTLQRATVQSKQPLLHGDADYLVAMQADASQRAALAADAIQNYRRAITLNRLLILQFGIQEEVAVATFPQGVTRRNVSAQTPDLKGLMEKAVAATDKLSIKISFHDDYNENLLAITRATERLKMLGEKEE